MIVDDPKTTQLMPMSIGPKFSSLDDGIISLLSIATDTVKPVKGPVQSSLITRRREECICIVVGRRAG